MRYLILLLIPIVALSEVKVTDNLIINNNFEQGNTNSWTTNGDVQVIGDCCELNNIPSNYDLEFGDAGSIEQDFNLTSDTITQPMLDNGITLNSSVEVQNGEGGEGGWAGKNKGGSDTFVIRLQIKDANQNILSTTTQIRQTTTDIYGQNFTDSVTYTGIGSNIGNIHISGIDENAPDILGGANIDNVSVTMTYDDIVVLSSEETEHINSIVAVVQEPIIEEIIIVEAPVIEETITVEEPIIEEIILSAQQTNEIVEIFEEIEEVFTQEEFTQIQELVFEEIYIEPVQEEVFVETIQEMPELTLEEQFVEETIVLSPVIMEEEIMEAPVEMVEETVVEESTMESIVEPEMEVEESVEVAEEVFEEMIAEAPIEQETIIEETEEISNEEETIEETEGDTNIDESNSDIVTEETETQNESGSVETQLTIENITIKVADKIKTTEGQLKAVSIIVAKVMQGSNKISSYSQVNAEIFKQPVIMDRNIDSYFSQTYVDVRNIYNDRTYGDREDWISR